MAVDRVPLAEAGTTEAGSPEASQTGDPLADAPRRGRGRPRGTGRIDPASIVNAALDALADGGYRSLSMRGVAREVGVSLATIQHHYPTKDALWRAAIDHLTDDAIERRSHVELTDLTGKIAVFLEQAAGRPGLLPAVLADRSPGSAERIEYLTERFTDAMAEPSERLRSLEAAGLTRQFDHRALFALITIGVGSIAGAADAVKSIYGFDLATERGRNELAHGLGDIIGLGVLRRSPR
ncbi:MAG: TetR/AcrR family transcriptional regulator [Actinomycetota bacterium]